MDRGEAIARLRSARVGRLATVTADARPHVVPFVFAIDAMGTKVAAVELTEGPPLVLLTDHVEGERPILVYRVDRLPTALEDLTGRGWERGSTFEIPHGPCCSFRTPGGHRVALYELARPEVAEHFAGRFDF